MSDVADRLWAKGVYIVECWRAGVLAWREETHNLVPTVGLNQILTAAILGAAAVGPYAGLISGSNFTGVALTDTLASHPGWLEAGGANLPGYTAPRKTPGWTVPAAGGIAWSAAQTFFITNGGTVAGAFQAFGTGATNLIDSTGGVLLSAAPFGVIQSVNGDDLVAVNYSLAMSG